MPDRYLYIFLDVFTITGPFLLSFDKKVAFYKDWKGLFPSLIIVSLFYLVWDVWFTETGIWQFNYRYLLGPKLFDLPLEEYGFFLVVPYACLFIYRVWQSYFPNWKIPIDLSYILLMCVTTIITALSLDKTYTAVTFGLISISMLCYRFIPALWPKIKQNWSHLFTAWVISIVPMLYVNGQLTIKPVLIYNNMENLGIRVFSIPVEDFFYNFLYMLWMIPLFEYFAKRKVVTVN
jgi:lycopene cyclase domain-containing protein